MATNNDDNPSPLPPFSRESAIQKVRLAKMLNTRDPAKVALVYAIDQDEEPIGVYQRTKRNRCTPHSQVVKELDYSSSKNSGVRREPDRVRFATVDDDSSHWYPPME